MCVRAFMRAGGRARGESSVSPDGVAKSSSLNAVHTYTKTAPVLFPSFFPHPFCGPPLRWKYVAVRHIAAADVPANSMVIARDRRTWREEVIL